jgi:hypothetical protein
VFWTYLYSFSDLTPLVVDFDHGKLQSNGVIKFMVKIKAAIEGCRWGSMKPGLKVFPRYICIRTVSSLTLKDMGFFGGVFFREVKFVLTNFLSNEELNVSYES